MTLPIGTLTFLFTDIEGSTKLLHDLGDRYAEVLADHRDILRNTFNKWNGSEVDTQGDSFFIAFSRASDALSAAMESQQALMEHSWPEDAEVRVRMGLHTGEPEVGATGYVGVDVHRAARISDAAHGGQILLSAATYELLRDDVLEDIALLDLGEHRMKDLSRPERLYQLSADGLISQFPPLRTLNNQRTNLPVQVTSFVGRESELSEITELIENPECRLLTLVGPGGIGKTRLALQTAAQHAHEYPDGTYFVPLAQLSSADFLVPTVAESLKFEFDTHISNLDSKNQLLEFLGEQSMFLVMDNFEHILEGASLIPEILNHAKNLQLIVTSRERLNLQGEWTYDVGGMSYPENGDHAGENGHSAMNLFFDRARQVDPGFKMIGDVRRDISQVCKLVDGIPLGIELAAAWVSVLSPEEIAEEIRNNLEFLASSRRDLEDKHRSMHAAFDYSWNLLSEPEQVAFKRLSMFRGGFQRDAAEVVASVDLKMLSDLVNKSLIKRTDEGRFEVHELLRQYANEKLRGDSQELEECSEKHCRYYVEFLGERKSALMGENLLEVREEIRGEMENVRSAVKWALRKWDSDQVRNMLKTYYDFLLVHGWHDARDTFIHLADFIRSERKDPAYPVPSKDPVYLLAKALEARLHIGLGAVEDAERIVNKYLPPIRELGEDIELASILFSSAVVSTLRGNFEEAVPVYDEALAVGRKCNADTMLAICLIYSGWNYYGMGDYERAEVDFEESYRMLDEQKNQWGKGFALSKLGLVAYGMKDYELSIKRHSEAREILTAFGDKAGIAYTTSRLSMGTYELGQYEEAKELGLEGFKLFNEIGHRWGMTATLCRSGFAQVKLGEIDQANAKFYKGLEFAMEFGYIPLALPAIGGIACCLVEKDEHTRAAELFEFFDNDPATHKIYKEIVKPWRSALGDVLSVEELELARARGREFEFEALVKELLREGREASVD
jgi:predicted ATPase/class 3 adenylate cyclase/tetratricopeptide (TPR) repeat protein